MMDARPADTIPGHLPPATWLFADRADGLAPGGLKRRVLAGEPVLIGRTRDGALFALRDICPHRLVPLSAGRQMEAGGEVTVECPYHGWRFGTDGVCRLIPSLTGDEGIDPGRISVASHGIAEAAGAVFVCLNAASTAPGPLPAAPATATGRPVLAERTLDAPWQHVARALFAGDASTPPTLAWTESSGLAVLTTVVPETAQRCRVARLVWPKTSALARLARTRIGRQNRRTLEHVIAHLAI